MAGHAQLKCVMTECSKTQIRLTGLKYHLLFIVFSFNQAQQLLHKTYLLKILNIINHECQ